MNALPGTHLMPSPQPPVISVMLAVPDAARAVEWYERALGAKQLWNLGSVVGLAVEGAAFFVGEPESNGWETPEKLGMPSVRIELFCDDPDAFIARALAAGATAGGHTIAVHAMPWGPHRQGGFVDPFGHLWFVGDHSPLVRHPR
jgi:PhnB protein